MVWGKFVFRKRKFQNQTNINRQSSGQAARYTPFQRMRENPAIGDFFFLMAVLAAMISAIFFSQYMGFRPTLAVSVIVLVLVTA